MKYLIYLLGLLLLSPLGSCSDGERGKESIPTLEVVTSSIDFDENGGTKNIDITTNQENWTAVVDAAGENWCTAVPDRMNDQNQLVVSTIANSYKEMRSTNITLKAGNLNKKITVRQLGTDKGILISPMMLSVKSEGEKINFTVTANVEFEIITPDWITLPASTRAAEYVTTEHTYFIQRNNGDKRTGSIVVKDKDSDLFSELTISQEAFGAYESPESSIKEDIIVPVSGGSAVNQLGENSQLSSSGFSRAYDGNKDTGYHSGDKRSDNEDKWPLVFTFEFTEQPSIEYFIYYAGGSEKMRKANIYVSTKEKPQYELLMENVEFTGTTSRITFPTPIINPLGIRVEAMETSGNYIIIKEMEFYRKNPDNYDPLELFTDLTCTELKAGITEKEINACPDPLFRNIAYYMFVDKYPREFRIQDYQAYPHPDVFKKENKTSWAHNVLDNPTGIFVNKGKEIVILVGDTHGYQLSARVLNLNVPGEDGFNKNYSYPLSAGINRFVPETDGLVYIYYHTPDYKNAMPIRIHIPSGQVNGYFDSRKHQATEWKRLLDGAVGPHFDLLGEKSHIIFPTDKFKSNTPDGKALVDAYDGLVSLEQEFMGLEKYNRMDPNRVCFSVMYNSSHMYASTYHTGYVIGTIDALTNLERFTTTDIWGPAHEVGHTYQTKQGLCWHGMAEVTNNIFSLYVQTSFGNNARLLDKQSGGYTSIYEKSMCMYLCPSSRHPFAITDDKINVFNQLVPFWQLHLYTKAKGNDDFYKDLYELVRTEPDKATPGESQVEFAVLASRAAGYDLTDFFTKWGFFEPIDIEKDDYGKKRILVTEDMATNAKQRIADLGLPKPTGTVEYICDLNADYYKNNNSIIKGTAQREGAKITMTGWKNVAAYEVYSDEELCFISPASSFTVVGKLDGKVQVFAVSASGVKEEVTF